MKSVLEYNYHYESQFKPNNSYEYIHTDDFEKFTNNVKTNKTNYSLHYYIKNPIEYKFNNYGFRTPDDFDENEEGNVYLGCSHTFGIGHHLENTWSYKLNKIIGGKFWNLGTGGTGVTTHFRLLLAYYKKFKIKNIFHYAPMYPRYEFIENGKPTYYIISDYNKDWKNKLGDLMVDCYLTNEQCEMNWLSYTYACRGLAAEIGCNYYLIQGDSYWHGNDDNSLQARDLLHHTTQYQHEVYQDFLKIMGDDYYDKYKDENQPILNIKEYIKNQKTNII